jgi:hypothetical protein
MNTNRFATAGWLAIAGGILTLPLMATGLILDIAFQKSAYMNPVFATLYLGFYLVQVVFVLYAFYRFKAYLNQELSFRKTDLLIIVLIAGMILISSVALIGRIVTWSGAPESTQAMFVASLFTIGLPLGILTVIFGIKLLDLKEGVSRLLRPYAYLHIAGGICFATFVLAPLGMLIAAVGDFLLGLILLGKGPAPQPEFV